MSECLLARRILYMAFMGWASVFSAQSLTVRCNPEVFSVYKCFLKVLSVDIQVQLVDVFLDSIMLNDLKVAHCLLSILGCRVF